MTLQRQRLVLREDENLADGRIDAVAQGKIDEAIAAPKADGGFRPMRRQRPQPFTLSTRQNAGDNIV
jgi:hypothetical protein